MCSWASGIQYEAAILPAERPYTIVFLNDMHDTFHAKSVQVSFITGKNRHIVLKGNALRTGIGEMDMHHIPFALYTQINKADVSVILFQHVFQCIVQGIAK